MPVTFSSVGIATRYRLYGPGIESRWGGGEIFRTRPDRPWDPPSLLHNEYRLSFPGVKRPGRGVDHPPLSSAEVKERVELHLYSPYGPSWPVLGWPLPLTFKLFPFHVNALSCYRIVLSNARARRDWQRLSQALRVDAKDPRSGLKERQEARGGKKIRNELKRK